MDLRQAIIDIYREGLIAVLPGNLIRDSVTVADDGLIIEGKGFPIIRGSKSYIFGSGKASIGAAKVFEDILPNRIAGGLIISSYNDSSLERIEVFVSSHPIPDERSLQAGDLLIDRLAALSEEDFFIYLQRIYAFCSQKPYCNETEKGNYLC